MKPAIIFLLEACLKNIRKQFLQLHTYATGHVEDD